MCQDRATIVSRARGAEQGHSDGHRRQRGTGEKHGAVLYSIVLTVLCLIRIGVMLDKSRAHSGAYGRQPLRRQSSHSRAVIESFAVFLYSGVQAHAREPTHAPAS